MFLALVDISQTFFIFAKKKNKISRCLLKILIPQNVIFYMPPLHLFYSEKRKNYFTFLWKQKTSRKLKKNPILQTCFYRNLEYSRKVAHLWKLQFIIQFLKVLALQHKNQGFSRLKFWSVESWTEFYLYLNLKYLFNG